MSAARPQLQSDDVGEPEKLRRVLNDILLGYATRLEALESSKGLVELEVSFETGAAVAVGTAPFAADGAGVRCSCPFTPTGLTLLRIDRTMPAGQPVSTSSHTVQWHFAAGPGAGEGAIHVDFVTGLEINSRYVLRIGVTRG